MAEKFISVCLPIHVKSSTTYLSTCINSILSGEAISRAKRAQMEGKTKLIVADVVFILKFFKIQALLSLVNEFGKNKKDNFLTSSLFTATAPSLLKLRPNGPGIF
jgi:hypothetical protein